ncbi:uncharacterized protein LOC132837351 [Hemiscyllium ocellatum]|uniref:uncharacterized protein LOC132837351 n=1 Tax=Hemiscyllium ocellatum TaxID=170820 RepID=UPI002967367B|nr:uncharacterized protein LOC132837351 [Hemiscyllium ocellatum]
MSQGVEVWSPRTDQDLHQRIMVCLQESSRKSAICLAQELHQPKATVQRCLYQLERQGQIKKADDKHWMLCGLTADDTTPTPPSLVPVNTMAGPVVSHNGNSLGPLEQDILIQLSSRGSATALQLAKFMGKESKKSVNPSLYALKRQGLVRQDGVTWSILPAREGDSAGSGRTSEWPKTPTDRAEPRVQMNNYHYSITYHIGDQITNIQQHGVTSNNITGGAHGNCYVQVGSQNTMTGRRDAGQRGEERPTAGGLKTVATESQEGGVSETGGTESQEGGVSETGGTEPQEGGVSETGGTEAKEGEVSGTGTAFHIDIIADQLSGLQIGNSNQMKFWSDPVNEDPVSDGSSSEDPFFENTEEE